MVLKELLFIGLRHFRDADDAVKARDGYDYDGYRLRVEFPRGGGPGSYRGGRDGGSNGGGGRGGHRDGNRGGRGPPTKRSQVKSSSNLRYACVLQSVFFSIV